MFIALLLAAPFVARAVELDDAEEENDKDESSPMLRIHAQVSLKLPANAAPVRYLPAATLLSSSPPLILTPRHCLSFIVFRRVRLNIAPMSTASAQCPRATPPRSFMARMASGPINQASRARLAATTKFLVIRPLAPLRNAAWQVCLCGCRVRAPPLYAILDYSIYLASLMRNQLCPCPFISFLQSKPFARNNHLPTHARPFSSINLNCRKRSSTRLPSC